MGARPRWALLSLALPLSLAPTWLPEFALGLSKALQYYGMDLAGGDMVRGPEGTIVATLAAGGEARHPIRRSGGAAGQAVFVTGWLGASAGGLSFNSLRLREALCRPTPPVRFGVALAEKGLVRAMMDLSDGIAADLPRLCKASGCGARIDADALPVHPDLPKRAKRLALVGGEDFGLLFTVDVPDIERLQSLARAHEIVVTRIGSLTDSSGPQLFDGSWPSPDFLHFPTKTDHEGAA